ncbi:hypothetical protein Ancab_012000 [Ancistrocladus abbreviatus]
MFPFKEENQENLQKFEWGIKKGAGANDERVQFYESFTYNGVEYFLYDNVYLIHEGAKETDIGKLVKIWESPTKGRLVKIVWFFRPVDVRNFLRDYEPRWNELFLASGIGKGISNVNPLEALMGKCNVICSSTDKRNPVPSKSDLREADYFFSHTFDVRTCSISKTFPDTIDKISVEWLFNRTGQKNNIHSHLEANGKPEGSNSCLKKELAGRAVANCITVGREDSLTKGSRKPNDADALLKRDVSVGMVEPSQGCSQLDDKTGKRISRNLQQRTLENQPLKKRKLTDFEQDCPSLGRLKEEQFVNPSGPPRQKPEYREENSKANFILSPKAESYDVMTTQHVNEDVKVKKKTIDVTRRPSIDTHKWFNELPWDERVQMAYKRQTLVWLGNLDTLYTSSDIEDIIWNAFELKADAKIIPQRSFCGVYYGQALAILKSEHAADTVISELSKRCLMIGKRPLVACRKTLTTHGKTGNFPGHLVIDKLRLRQGEEQRNAVSTSHCAQFNTIEYDMATEWRFLQAKSDHCWKMLHERQKKETLPYLKEEASKIEGNCANASAYGDA